MARRANSIQWYRSMASHTRQKESYRGGWVKLTPEEVKWFSAEGKQTIKEKVDKIIERYMKPSVVRSRGGRAGFGDVQDLYTKWHGDNLILIAKRRGGRGPGGYSEDFETKSGRLTLVGADLFDVSYFRHTGRWWTIATDRTLKESLEYFREPSPVWPW
jgi:hypothetical protein